MYARKFVSACNAIVNVCYRIRADHFEESMFGKPNNAHKKSEPNTELWFEQAPQNLSNIEPNVFDCEQLLTRQAVNNTGEFTNKDFPAMENYVLTCLFS